MSTNDARFDLNALDAGGFAVLLASVATSLLAAGPAPARLRIHWGSPYYGPEFAPAALVLAGFPLAVAGSYLGARFLGRRLLPVDERPVRRVLAVATVGTLVLLVAVQALVLALNLL